MTVVSKPRFRRGELLLLALVLLLAGVLRVAWPGLTEFKADEARLLALALEMADGRFALRGISSSVGFPNFPASVWIYSLPLLLWPHAYAATVFTGLLNTTAVGACYWFVRRYWGSHAALAATLLYAVSPWAVIFSRKIWAQNLLPLFVMAWVIGAALAFVEHRPRFLWLHLVALALAVQIHLAAVALVPATLLLLIIFRRRLTWRHLLLGGLMAALTALPFALYLWRAFQASGAVPALGAETQGALTLDSLRFTLMITLGTAIHSLAGPEAYLAYLERVPNLTIVYVLWALLALAGIIWLARQAGRRRDEPAGQVSLIILIWLLAPPLFFLWHSTPVFLHYFIAVLPAPYIAVGAFVTRLPSLLNNRWPTLRSRLAARVVWLILLLSAAAQVTAWLVLLNFLATNATPGGFGTPLHLKLEAVTAARALAAETGAAEILIAGQGEQPAVDEFPAEFEVLLRDVPRRFVDTRRSALFPAANAVVLLDARQTEQPWTGDIYLSVSSGAEEVTLRPGEGAFYVLPLTAGSKPTPAVPADPVYLLANWVNLTGHDQPRLLDDSTLLWQIHWQTGDNPDPAQYQFFNHLLNAQGERLAQVDAAAFTPAQWRAGDAVISRFLLPWPADPQPPLSMRVGMYRFPSLENVPLLDVAGNPYSDAATFLLDNIQW